MKKVLLIASIFLIASCSNIKRYTIEVTYNDKTKDTITVPSKEYPSIHVRIPDYGTDPVTELSTGEFTTDVIAVNVYKFRVLNSN